MIGHNQQKRDRLDMVRRILATEQSGPRRDITPMSSDLRRRLNDRWESQTAKELAGDNA